MNILPKKSWHVRNKDNIERVRRDEAKAAEEEKERQRKISLAEQEARISLLRDRAKSKSVQLSPDPVDRQLTEHVAPKHINLFQAEQDGTSSTRGNKDYEREKQEEKEKQEKAIGLLTYLGQSAAEAQTSKPWYFKAPETESADDDKRLERDMKRKNSLDPLTKMVEYIDKKHKHKKHKEKHKHKDKIKIKKSSGQKSIEQLRHERLVREQSERLKTERLMAQVRGEKVPGEEPDIESDDRKRGYNSQFNPDIAKRGRRDEQSDRYKHSRYDTDDGSHGNSVDRSGRHFDRHRNYDRHDDTHRHNDRSSHNSNRRR